MLNLAAFEAQLTTSFLGRRLLYATTLTSTQDMARREAAEGAPEGTVVIAEEQTAGRGRLGRSWVSPPGDNLYLTLLLRPTLTGLRALTMVAPLACVQAAQDTTGVEARIKWPNDVLVNRRKLAGILIDTELMGEQPEYTLVGIGLNVNMDVESQPEVASIATSLRAEAGREVPREEALASLLNSFEALYQKAGKGQELREAWKARLETLGKRVNVRFGDIVEEGLAEDVDEEGNLLLRLPGGALRVVSAGEVTLRV